MYVDRLRDSRPLAFFADDPARKSQSVERTGPNQVAITAENERGGRLVLLDLAFPGWSVSIDGKPAASEVFENMYRAVDVPAGRHEIVWRYQPVSAKRGAIVSAAAILIWIVAAVIMGRRRRRAAAA
jgi:uncharacterized membrane protein YfhO